MRTSASRGLGQPVYDTARKAFISFKMVEVDGRPIPSKKFYFDFLPNQAYQADMARDARNETHFSLETDANGIAEVWVTPYDLNKENYLRYLVSITPLFDGLSAPKNKAVIWQVPMRFDPNRKTVTTIVNKPGGGFKSGANVIPPAPDFNPGGPEDHDDHQGWDVPTILGWGVFGLGVVAVTYFFVLPKIFGKGR
jgi:hypothetical protein